MSQRRGWTRFDVLVGIGIAAGVTSLAVVITSHIRQTAFKTRNTNNLKQIALGVHNYALAHNDNLPPLVDFGKNSPTGAGLQSLFFNLLPYMDQDDLYRQFDRIAPNSYYDRNLGVAQTRVTTFINPLDDTAPDGTTTNATVTLPTSPPAPFAQNFTGVYGTTSYAANGLIPWNTGGISRSFVDGNSNTIMFAERFQVCDDGTTKTYNLWGYGMYGPSMPTFAMLTPDKPAGLTSTGQVATAEIPPNGIKTFEDPNSASNEIRVRIGMVNAPERQSYPYAFQLAPRAGQCDPAVPQASVARALFVALADGSVRTVSPTLSQWTFWAACTPAGREELYKEYSY